MGKYLQNVCLRLKLQFKQIIFILVWKHSIIITHNILAKRNTKSDGFIIDLGYVKLLAVITSTFSINSFLITNVIYHSTRYHQCNHDNCMVDFHKGPLQELLSKINYSRLNPNELRFFSG